MEVITWPVAISIIGVVVVIMTFISTQIRTRAIKPWDQDVNTLTSADDNIKSDLRELEHRITVVEGRIDQVIRDIEGLRFDLLRHNETVDKQVEKIEEKLEKVTDVTINILQDVSRK